MKKIRSRIAIVLILVSICLTMVLTGCSSNKADVIIYSSGEDYRLEDMRARLKEKFPNYKIEVEYIATGNHAAKLLAEGKSTDCDITHDLDYAYLEQLVAAETLADLSSYDRSIYVADAAISNYFLPELRNGGAIIVNPELLKEKGLKAPTSYADLLKPEYKGLISMPNPKSSGTGYIFVRALVNEMGEDKAFEYFDKLNDNIFAYTTSGSGPVNALIKKEAAIGLGMTAQAATAINDGTALDILYFEEGSPYSLYGQAMIKGKETKPAVKEVFDFLINTYSRETLEKFYPEKIFADKDYEIKNYPTNIKYSDMSGSTGDEKTRLLEKWKY